MLIRIWVILIWILLIGWSILKPTMSRTGFYGYLAIALLGGGIAFFVSSPSDCGYRILFIVLASIAWCFGGYFGFLTWRGIPYEETGSPYPTDPILNILRKLKQWWHRKTSK